MLSALRCSIRQGLSCALRKRADLVAPPAFFAMVTSLFPLGVGADPALLLRMAPGVLWVGALLASMLALHHLFEPDLADGTLEQMLLAPAPAVLLVAGRVAAHWLVSALPLALIAPVLALQYGMPAAALGVLCASLLLGTVVLSLLGAVGAALALGARGGSMLVALILLPLYIPVLILGAGAVAARLAGGGAGAHLMALAGLACGALALAPWAATAALRVALE